jgi:hypothetical protein
VDRDHHRRSGRHGDRREVLDRVVRRLAVERDVADEGADREQKRVPVGRRPRDLHSADIAAAAGNILHEELPAELLREPRRHDSCINIGRTARTECNDDAHRPARIIQRTRYVWLGKGDGRSGPGKLQKATARLHGLPLPVITLTPTIPALGPSEATTFASAPKGRGMGGPELSMAKANRHPGLR